MKNYYLFLLFIVLLGCTQPQSNSHSLLSSEAVKKSVKATDTLQSIIEANIHKLPVVDTVFLGFTFSMTKEQSMKHFNQLIKEKKLVMDDQSHRIVYPLSFELIKAKAVIAPEFQDDKLYKLSLVILPVDDIATSQTVYLQAATAYMKKYTGYTLFQEPGLIDANDKNFHWIKNNLHIFLHKTIEGSVVSYINMPVEELINKNKAASSDSSKTQTNKDI